MTVADLQQYIGQRLTVTGPDAGQCTAVAHRWEQMLGLPIVYGDAVDTLNNGNPQYYDRIVNTPDNVPSPGDILVWGQNSSIGTGSVGHTAVFLNGDQNSFNSIDQNWPTGSNVKVIHHDYRGVLGWLHPKSLNTGGGVSDITHEQYDAVVNDNYNKQVQINTLTQQVNDEKTNHKYFEDKSKALQATVDQLQKQVADLQKQVDAQKPNVDLDSYSLGDLLSAAFKKTFKIK